MILSLVLVLPAVPVNCGAAIFLRLIRVMNDDINRIITESNEK